ncbi:MAG: hypothetical protein HWE27_10545 [Gammaproteobacteria bacterium]|nr:hypothetical protein [Gammaproteobacteria bacterium]
MKQAFAVLIMFLALPAMAASYSAPSTVKGISVGDGYVRIKLDQMKAAEDCADQDWYVLDTTNDKYAEMSLSVILSAKVSQTKLSFQLVGCQTVGSRNYPKINHTYFCEETFCA